MYNQICPPDSTRHVVKNGDTLWKLSQTYGVSVQNLIDANPGINANNLQIGSSLCVPAAPTRPPIHTCPDNASPYIIHSGDTLWKLSQVYGVTVQSILDINPGIDPQNLQIGSTVCIPTAPFAPFAPTPPSKTAPLAKTAPPIMPPAPAKTVMPAKTAMPVTCPKGSFSYTIKAGDTLWKLSQVYGVSVQSILDINPGIDPQNLQIGSTVCIPTAPFVPFVPTPPTKTAPLAKTAPPIMPPAPAKTVMPAKTAAPVTCPKGSFSYTIKAGDTLWKLSQVYGVSVQSILDINPGIDPQNLQIGSTVCIPTAPVMPITPIMPAPPVVPTPPVVPSPPTMPIPPTEISSERNFAYLIKRCDTICGIARKFYVSVESILNENPMINPRCLRVGTYIYVPINCCGENTWRYTVRRGDTLNRIANKLNVCPSDIIAANPNIDFKHLVHCQVICIPKD